MWRRGRNVWWPMRETDTLMRSSCSAAGLFFLLQLSSLEVTVQYIGYTGIPVKISSHLQLVPLNSTYTMIFIFYFSLKMSVGASTVPPLTTTCCLYLTGTVTIISRSKHILCENLDPDPGLWYLCFFLCTELFLAVLRIRIRKIHMFWVSRTRIH